MWHTPCCQINQVDSQLFLVGSQIGSLTPDPSFGHNFCFRCPNEQCEPILAHYKERHKLLSFDPCDHSLKFSKSTETPILKVGVTLGV
jgi:hypothetical protein